ncbi:MAG: hypothetical protein LBP54_04925 [Campylobacteraceae bacterium]|jgi:ABC-type multidrug transport system permease subunit|nr:hypothetical protein [Campylobacteraceae bacterium]
MDFLGDIFWYLIVIALFIPPFFFIREFSLDIGDDKDEKREMLWRVPVSIIAWIVGSIVVVAVIAFILYLIAMAIKVIIYFVNM